MSGKTFDVGGKASLATLEGWQTYVRADPKKPKALTRAQYDALSPSQRATYDSARTTYHRGIESIETEQMRAAHDKMTSYAEGSAGAPPVARTGVMLNGMPRVGKTTIGVSWAKKAERALRAEYGWGRTSAGAQFVPVFYGIVGFGSGTRAMMRKFLDFYGQPWKEGWDVGVLTGHFADMVHRCGTQYILLDQMQNLDLSRQGDKAVSAHLKELMDTCPATFFGMGVGLETTGLFTEGRRTEHHALAQIAGRFNLHPVAAAEIETEDGRAQWERLLRTFESKTMLLDARQGDLCAELADYIYLRTGGVTGEVMDLLRRGANEAITSGGPERITRKVLSRVSLSHRATTDDADAEEYVA